MRMDFISDRLITEFEISKYIELQIKKEEPVFEVPGKMLNSVSSDQGN